MKVEQEQEGWLPKSACWCRKPLNSKVLKVLQTFWNKGLTIKGSLRKKVYNEFLPVQSAMAWILLPEGSVCAPSFALFRSTLWKLVLSTAEYLSNCLSRCCAFIFLFYCSLCFPYISTVTTLLALSAQCFDMRRLPPKSNIAGFQ